MNVTFTAPLNQAYATESRPITSLIALAAGNRSIPVNPPIIQLLDTHGHLVPALRLPSGQYYKIQVHRHRSDGGSRHRRQSARRAANGLRVRITWLPSRREPTCNMSTRRQQGRSQADGRGYMEQVRDASGEGEVLDSSARCRTTPRFPGASDAKASRSARKTRTSGPTNLGIIKGWGISATSECC